MHFTNANRLKMWCRADAPVRPGGALTRASVVRGLPTTGGHVALWREPGEFMSDEALGLS